MLQLRSLAKINLDLRVLYRRPDGYHELRTVFQTISLADRIGIAFERARRTHIVLDDPLAIPDNLMIRAAQAVLDRARVRGRVRMTLDKRIPMGAGLGGGSSNAAAVLLALPALIGWRASLDELIEVGGALGSDVPFFLLGGTVLGIGRGTELIPLPDLKPEPVLLVCPDVHVSTQDAYRALGRGGLTVAEPSSTLKSFPAYVRALLERRSAGAASALSANDFEAEVFRQHPQLQVLLGKFAKCGAAGARMTGSGSAVFGIFESRAQREHARGVFERDRAGQGCRVVQASLVGRRRYRALWRRQTGAPVSGEVAWPPPNWFER
jgi:4-diphosphocytidyl-2-C-methyl-D-erythritol kinase